MKHLKKKGVLDSLGEIVTSLGVIAILAAVIFLIIAESQDQVVSMDGVNESDTGLTWTPAYNASLGVQSATSDVPGWLPIVVITLIGGVLLTLVRFFKQK